MQLSLGQFRTASAAAAAAAERGLSVESSGASSAVICVKSPVPMLLSRNITPNARNNPNPQRRRLSSEITTAGTCGHPNPHTTLKIPTTTPTPMQRRRLSSA